MLTGQIGDVMKESAQAALSLIKSRAGQLGIDSQDLLQKDIHIHVPAGHYSVEAKSPHWVVSAVDISYEGLDHVEIHNRGCADLALHAVRARGSR